MVIQELGRLILSGKILKQTDKIHITDQVLVLVNIKDFLGEGSNLFRNKKSLEKLFYLKIINRYELLISKIIQKISEYIYPNLFYL